MRYPKHRKSPIKHKVRTHTRQGRLIQSFTRGKGKPVQKQHNPFTKKVKVKRDSPKRFRRLSRGDLERARVREEGKNYIFYHTSYASFRPKILSKGLKPHRLKEPEENEPRFPVLYLAKTPKGALYLSEDDEWREEFSDEIIDVYKVKIPKNIIIYEDPYGGDYIESVFITTSISPKNLELIEGTIQ